MMEHPAVDFLQREMRVYSKQRRASVPVTCPKCGYTRFVPETRVKQYINRGSYTGKCRRCAIQDSSCGGGPGQPSGSNHAMWQGGRIKNAAGYIEVSVNGLDEITRSLVNSMARKSGYILEHRLVMAQELGRPLEQDEVVRHINGVKDDNRPENLALGSHADNCLDHVSLRTEIARLRKENNGLRALAFFYCLILSRRTRVWQGNPTKKHDERFGFRHWDIVKSVRAGKKVVGSVRSLKEKVLALRTSKDSNYTVSYSKSRLLWRSDGLIYLPE